jgi:hypothetical protein
VTRPHAARGCEPASMTPCGPAAVCLRSWTSEGALLDAVEEEFLPALKLLARRAGGDYRPDRRPEKFAPPDPKLGRPVVPEGIKPSGLTAWAAFELWIAERKPAASSVNRWRAVFNGLREKFGNRDLATITPNEAQDWIDGLTTEDRSAHVVNDVWLRAVLTVFKWAVTL